MKLYSLSKSPNCRKVLAVIEHLELNVEIISKDTSYDDLNKEEYLAINPNGMVPALVDGDFKLWESNAIMQYLASIGPENGLYPEDTKVRCGINRWLCWESNHFNRAIGTIIWETIVKSIFNIPGEPDENLIKSSLIDFHRFAPVLEKQLDGQAFISGETLTLADLSVCSLSTLVLLETSRIPLEQYPNIKSWYNRLEETSSWEKFKPSF